MRRKNTKAKQILEKARQRVAVGESIVEDARHQLGMAEAALRAYKHDYEELERDLAPQPRQSAGKVTIASGSKGKATTETLSRAAKKSSTKKRAGLEAAQPVTPDICAYILSDTNHCMESKNNPIHDPTMGYRDYHPFVSPAAPARNAQPKSSANGASSAPVSDTQNSAQHSMRENGDAGSLSALSSTVDCKDVGVNVSTVSSAGD